MRIQPHDGARRCEGDERVALFADDRGAGIGGIRPLGHPLQSERRVEAVEVRQTRQQPERMFAHVVAKAAVLEFHHGGRKRSMPAGTSAVAGELAKRAVDDGEGGGFRVQAGPERSTGWG